MGEFSSDIETVVEEGFDVIKVHISCPLPHAHSINVSIMGLRSYIEDEEKANVLILVRLKEMLSG